MLTDTQIMYMAERFRVSSLGESIEIEEAFSEGAHRTRTILEAEMESLKTSLKTEINLLEIAFNSTQELSESRRLALVDLTNQNHRLERDLTKAWDEIQKLRDELYVYRNKTK